MCRFACSYASSKMNVEEIWPSHAWEGCIFSTFILLDAYEDTNRHISAVCWAKFEQNFDHWMTTKMYTRPQIVLKLASLRLEHAIHANERFEVDWERGSNKTKPRSMDIQKRFNGKITSGLITSMHWRPYHYQEIRNYSQNFYCLSYGGSCSILYMGHMAAHVCCWGGLQGTR